MLSTAMKANILACHSKHEVPLVAGQTPICFRNAFICTILSIWFR